MRKELAISNSFLQRQWLAKTNLFIEKELAQTNKGEAMKTLKDAKVGTTVVVSRLQGEGPTKRRIMDMGITKGTMVKVQKIAPLGDPMEITVRGYELSIRKMDAEMIELVEVNNDDKDSTCRKSK